MCRYVCLWVGMLIWVQLPSEARGVLGTGVTDRCEPSDMAVGHQTQGSWKSNKRSQPQSHHSNASHTHFYGRLQVAIQFIDQMVCEALNYLLPVPIQKVQTLALYDAPYSTLCCSGW